MSTAVSLISVIVPCYNEERRLPKCLAALQDYLHRLHVGFEIIVVDDGSSDRTSAIAESWRDRIPELRVCRLKRNQGKGAAVRAGMLASGGDRIAFTDTDLSVPLDFLAKLLSELDSYDIAIASRALRSSRIVSKQGFVREAFALTFDMFRRMLVVRGVNDTQCGMKAFRGDAGRLLFSKLTTSSQLFDIEVLTLAAREGMTVVEIPAVWIHDPDSRIRYGVRSSIRIFRELLRIKWRYRLLRPLRVRATRRSSSDIPEAVSCYVAEG